MEFSGQFSSLSDLWASIWQLQAAVSQNEKHDGLSPGPCEQVSKWEQPPPQLTLIGICVGSLCQGAKSRRDTEPAPFSCVFHRHCSAELMRRKMQKHSHWGYCYSRSVVLEVQPINQALNSLQNYSVWSISASILHHVYKQVYQKTLKWS